MYGKIEIGEKKSRPLFHTVSLNLLITDVLTFFALKVMTFHDTFSLSNDLLMLALIYVLQLLVSRILIFSVNSLYFINYIPERTIIINHESDQLNKIVHYIKRHSKQYELLAVIDNPGIHSLDFNEVDNVFVLGSNNEFLSQMLLKVMLLDIKVFYESDIDNIVLGKKEIFVVDDVLLHVYNTMGMSLNQKFIKRSIDILFSMVALFFVWPVMIFVSIMIKLDDGGPVIFTQERITQHGKVFRIYKFRSMRLNAGDIPAEKNDDRITRSGIIIRKLRLDELPQLFNIIKGDMSIVGPRPESVVITQKITETVPNFGFRLKVKAGLTGTAQILGKYNTRPQEKLLFDLYYIENFSILNDLKLMFQTLIVFIKNDSTEGFEKKDTSNFV